MGDLSTKFIVIKSFSLDPASKIQTIEYGNQAVGWFCTSRFVIAGDSVAVTLLPPTYRQAVAFRVVTAAGATTPLGSSHFTSPVGDEFEHIVPEVLHGSAQAPFLAMVGALPYVNLNFAPPETKANAAFVFVINRLGEVVWLHFLDRGRTAVRDTIEMRPASGGLALFAADEGLFEEVGLTGEVRRRTRAGELLPVSSWRRGFVLQGDDLIVGGRKTFYARQGLPLWAPPKASKTPVLQRVVGSKQNTVWRAARAPAADLATIGDDRMVSIEQDADGNLYMAYAPSGRVIVVDPEMKKNLATSVVAGAKLLHAAVFGDQVLTLQDDGRMASCSVVALKTGRCQWQETLPNARADMGRLTRGRLIESGPNTLGVFAVETMSHSFRRRTIKPDRYLEFDRKTGAKTFELSIPQYYHSAATSALPLASLLGEATGLPGDQPGAGGALR